MYQTHSQPKQHHITLLDKCTQILREDRIWLRNLLKSGHEEAINLFRGLPKNVDMKQLQIKLRKYIMRAKERQKQQQLQRFKENMQLPDFVQMAAQKKHQVNGYAQPKGQQAKRGPLVENEHNYEQRSSFVAKWNNYSHYNPKQAQQSRHFQSQHQQINNSSLTRPVTTSVRKDWSNNYKPHSFNKNLNYELGNKLSLKNSSTNIHAQKSRHNLSTTSLHKTTKDKRNDKSMLGNSSRRMVNNEEMQESGRFGNGVHQGRNSSKSLKQLQSRIYQELKLFQQNKSKRESEGMNRSFTQKSVQKLGSDKQRGSSKFSQPRQSQPQVNPQSVSKQSIDEILKFKLGNCDFESYKREQINSHQQDNFSHANNQSSTLYNGNATNNNYVNDVKPSSSSQKKIYYDDSMFPPIQEQTERDSESQRYPEEPLRFGFNNGQSNSLKFELQERQRNVFASFAKGGSPNQLNRSKQYAQADDRMLQSFNPQSIAPKQSPMTNTFGNKQPLSQRKKISESLYQSAQKSSDNKDDFVESDLHRSIMESIKKSRQMYPLQNNNQTLKVETQIPYRPATSEVASFTSSLYASTNQNDGIFTSPQLLNECRNFLKKTQEINFQNSGLGSNFTQSLKNTRFDSPTSSQQKSFNFQQAMGSKSSKQNDDGLMIQFPQPITITESITKDYYENYGEANFSQSKINSLFESKQSIVQKNIQFETYSKPQEMVGSLERIDMHPEQYSMQNSVKQNSNIRQSKQAVQSGSNKQHPSLRKDEGFIVGHSRKNSSIKRHSQIQETLVAHQPSTMQFSIANQENQTSNEYQYSQNHEHQFHEENYRTSEFVQIPTMEQRNEGRKQVTHQLWEVIDLEDVIDRLLEANQGNLEMESTWLKHTLANHCIFDPEAGMILSQILREFIIQPSQTHNFIDLLDVLYAYYKTNCPNYRPKKSPASDIYSLLDIQEKGYIVQQDLHNFIVQLEGAGVQNIDEISQNLRQTFELADFLSIKKIGYVNLYVIKNQDCFDALWGELQQFEFEVEGEQ